jgi:hypothetical protein
MAVCWLSARTCSLLRPFQKTDLAGEWLGIGFLESVHLVLRTDHATRREQVQALDNVAMLELDEWLNHMRFRLFGRSAAVGPTG